MYPNPSCTLCCVFSVCAPSGMHEVVSVLFLVLFTDACPRKDPSVLVRPIAPPLLQSVLGTLFEGTPAVMSSETLFGWIDVDSPYESPTGVPHPQESLSADDDFDADGEAADPRFLEPDLLALFEAVMRGSGSGSGSGSETTPDGLGAVAFYEDKTPASPGVPAREAPVQIVLERVWGVLCAVDAQLHGHLSSLGILPQLFMLKWVRLLFGREFHVDDLLLIWDALFDFAEESNVAAAANRPARPGQLALVEGIAAAMILFLRPHLMECSDMGAALKRLQKFPPVEDVRVLIERGRVRAPKPTQSLHTPSHTHPYHWQQLELDACSWRGRRGRRGRPGRLCVGDRETEGSLDHFHSVFTASSALRCPLSFTPFQAILPAVAAISKKGPANGGGEDPRGSGAGLGAGAGVFLSGFEDAPDRVICSRLIRPARHQAPFGATVGLPMRL